jgi:uncharacterized RDD family membrane protein YckC
MWVVMNAIAHASAAPLRGPKLDNRRILAAGVDLLIVALGAAVVLFAGDALSSDTADIQGALGAVVLGWALYYFFALESGDGQTVGKKLMKLRVVREDGSPAGMREIAIRTILRVVDNYLVGLIVMLLTGERRQRIGDLAAGTVIVDASGPAYAPAPPAAAAEEQEPEEDEISDEADLEVADAAEELDEPADTATITLPARPEPPATIEDLSAPEAPAAPDVPEMTPFPPADEPVDDEVVAEEPVAEEPVAHGEPAAEEDEPVDELAAITTPSLEELARDVAAVQAEDAEPVVEAADEAPADERPADDEPVNVKSVETVSAIDLIMGGDPAQEPDS